VLSSRNHLDLDPPVNTWISKYMNAFILGFVSFQLPLIALMLMPALLSRVDVWWLDNLINFQLQWATAAIVSVLLSLIIFRVLSLPLAVIFLPIILYNFVPLFSTTTPDSQTGALFKLAQLNISYENRNIDNIVLDLIDSDYDAVLIQEIADGKVKNFDQLLQAFPYSIGANSTDSFSSSQALFSRWPLANRRVHDLGYVEGKIIEVTIAPADGVIPVRILALHPGAPRSAELWRLRNKTLEYIAEQTSGSPVQHQIVIGDFNVSPWSPFFKTLVSRSGLQDGVSGYGYIPSWSPFSSNSLTRLLSSAYIDHCLVSSSITVRGKSHSFIEGSDHVLVETLLELH
jgi:endonuclease/exonuclease/phosphatase (EEP) superfamily protein YafD